jgi:hypothetical protein
MTARVLDASGEKDGGSWNEPGVVQHRAGGGAWLGLRPLRRSRRMVPAFMAPLVGVGRGYQDPPPPPPLPPPTPPPLPPLLPPLEDGGVLVDDVASERVRGMRG